MKKSFCFMKIVSALFALALFASCDSGGGGGGGGSSGGGNSTGSADVKITIPKSTSSDISILGDFQPSYADNFYYEIYYSKPDGSSKSSSQFARTGGTVTFSKVKYDTYTFFLKIWVDNRMKQVLTTDSKTVAVSESESKVEFPDRSVSDYANWYFVLNAEQLTGTVNTIKSSNSYNESNKAIICLRDNIELPNYQSKLASVSSKAEVKYNGWKIAEQLFNVNILGSITGGTVKASPTKGAFGDEITLTVQTSEHYRFKSLKKDGEELTVNDDGTVTFNMPASNVNITAEFVPLYAIEVGTITGGSVTAKLGETVVTEAAANDEITLTVQTFEHYRFKSLKKGGEELAVTDGTATFIMPASNVNITAEFVPLYQITIGTITGGGAVEAKLGESAVTEAAADDEITLFVTTNDGYVFDEISVTGDGSTVSATPVTEGVEYKFTMPPNAVTVGATFLIVVPEFKITLTAPTGLRTTETSDGDTVYLVAKSDLTAKKFTLKAEPVTATDSIPDGTEFSWGFNSTTSYTEASADNQKDVEIGTMCNITSAPSSQMEYTIYCKASLEGGAVPGIPASVTVNLKGGLIGNKSAPDAVGDIVFSDGSATAYDDSDFDFGANSSSAVAVIFDAASKKGVGLQEGAGKVWSTDETITINGTSSSDGSGNWNVIKSVDTNAEATAAARYPAFYYANTYSVTGYPAGTWYIPAKDELNLLCGTNLSVVNTALGKISGATQINTNSDGVFRYWASTGFSNPTTVYGFFFDINHCTLDHKDNTNCAVRVMRKFD